MEIFVPCFSSCAIPIHKSLDTLTRSTRTVLSFTPDLSTEVQYEKQIGTLQQQDRRIQELEAEIESLKTKCGFKIEIHKIRSVYNYSFQNIRTHYTFSTGAEIFLVFQVPRRNI